jgi:large subunit ribosomal protein L23
MSQDRVFRVLIAPHISEKATIAAEKRRQFVFKVAKDATKPEIKAAVEELFSVKVKSVQTTIVPGKSKRFGRFEGRRGDTKKAYVSLQPGFDISFVGAE